MPAHCCSHERGASALAHGWAANRVSGGHASLDAHRGSRALGPRLGPAETTKWRKCGAAPPATWPDCRWRYASSQAPSEDEDPDEEIEDEGGEAGGADEHHTADEEADENDEALAGFWRGKDQAEDGAT